MNQGTSGGRLVRQSMLASIEPARAAEEITIERHVRGQAFLHQQVPARSEIVRPAPILDLTEVILGDQFGDREPEIVTVLSSGRSRVQDQLGNDRIERVAAAVAELNRQVGRPGQHAVGHRLHEHAHQRGFIGKGRP